MYNFISKSSLFASESDSDSDESNRHIQENDNGLLNAIHGVSQMAIDDTDVYCGDEVDENTEVLEREDLESKNIQELKQILRERGKKVSGNKADLINRILESYEDYLGGEGIKPPEELVPENLRDKSVSQLKQLLEDKGLSTKGKKPTLINRLLGVEEVAGDDFQNLPTNKLKEKLKASNLPTGGTKAMLINRLMGLEEFESGSYEEFDRYTTDELTEKLKSLNRDTGGKKEDLINRLLGKEPPMPKESWKKSDDKALLIAQLRDAGQNSLRFKTAEEVNELEPFCRWPLYRFRDYFKTALLLTLREESIAERENFELLDLVEMNPRPEGKLYWDKHIASQLLKEDFLDAIESDEEIVPKRLWESRVEYRDFDLKVFRNQLTAMRRRFREFPGWQFSRNKKARQNYEEVLESEN